MDGWMGVDEKIRGHPKWMQTLVINLIRIILSVPLQGTDSVLGGGDNMRRRREAPLC